MSESKEKHGILHVLNVNRKVRDGIKATFWEEFGLYAPPFSFSV